MADNNRGFSFNQQIARYGDYAIAIGVVSVVLMLIIPLPMWMLDLLIALNLMISLVILLTVMFMKRAADMSVFPSLLLITTVFRLAINVSSTRLILLWGAENGGNMFDVKIIQAFGDYVVGGNYVVGIIIFLVIIALQFIVITKGSVRVAEVAARFTLDAMPGKQMSIDADLHAGIIDEREAIKRRQELRQEADFYGAMDGSSKFVQGDVRVGLLITFINIIGGLIVGTVLYDLPIGQAFAIFIMLTIGDGLVAQIPSLMLSTATGIIVTRAVSEDSLGQDMGRQLLLKPKAMLMTGVFLIALGILPGFPMLILWIIGALLIVAGYYMQTREETIEGEREPSEKAEEPAHMPESVVDLITVEPLELEIGFNLVPFVDSEQGGDLLERVKLIRKSCALDLGLVVPPIRIRDNMKLKPSDYSIKIKGVEVGHGSLRVKKLLAIPGMEIHEEIEGEDTLEPAFGTPAKWIDETQRDRAESLGYNVVDCPSIIATHLTEIIKSNASEILGRQEVKQLVDNIKETYPAVVEEVFKVVSLGQIQKVLQNLLREQISIRNMITILETIADYGGVVTNMDTLTEYVRSKLAKQISSQFADEQGKIHALVLDPQLESTLEESIQETDRGMVTTLDIDTLKNIEQKTIENLSVFRELGVIPVIVCSSRMRATFKRITERFAPGIIVISYDEVVPPVSLESKGVISIKEEDKVPTR